MSRLVHIYAVCPSALLTGELNSFLGAEKGRFIGTLPSSKRFKTSTSWNGMDIAQNEIPKFKDLLDYLQSKGAIIQIGPGEKARKKATLIERIETELLDENSPYSVGIIDQKTGTSLDKQAVTISEFKDKGLYDFQDVDIPQSPKAFFDSLPEQVIKSTNTFSLIDPYIYEIKSDLDASNRLEFLRILEERYKLLNNSIQHPLKIQVFGAPTDKFFDKNVVMNWMRQSGVFGKMLPSTKIDFFVFKKYSKNEFKKKMHLRYFVAGKFCWNFEETSEDRKGALMQVWRFIVPKHRKFIDQAYRVDGQVFDKLAHFTKSQITLR